MPGSSDNRLTRRFVERAAARALRAARSGYELQPRWRPLGLARHKRSLDTARSSDQAAPVTSLLASRLSGADISNIKDAISRAPELAGQFAAAGGTPSEQRLLLAFGIWLGIDAVCEKTGLRPLQPPAEVHAMARGPLAAAGGLYEADMVAQTLADAGIALADLDAVLDFGCSSGRVLSVLAAAYPQVRLSGCDPNSGAIAWASEHLPAASFFVSPQHPPLDLPDSSLDLVYAISIWSHFAPALGLSWLEEMHRLLRPGGLLLLTTHGLTSLHHYLASGERLPTQVEEIMADLYRHGAWYTYEFGEHGDWGVKDPEWGTAFLTAEWLLAHLCPRFHVLAFLPGRNQGNQDVYLLRRS